MSKWKMVKLGDICTVVSGTTPKSNIKEYWNGEYNWVTPAELNDNTVYVNETQRKITQLGIKSASLKLFPVGTVLLSSRAPIGKVAIAGTDMYCNQGFKNLICSDKVFNKYLFWFLKCHKDYLNSLGRGATFKEISKKIVEQIPVLLPTKEVQYKIASTLDTVSDLLNLRKQRLAELDKLIQAVFYEMFGDPLTNKKDWDKKALGELTTALGDGLHGTPSYCDDGKYYFINGNNLNNGKIVFTNKTKRVNSKEFLKYEKPLNETTILVSINGSLGHVAYYNNEKIVLGKSTCYLNLKTYIINLKFLYQILNSDFFKIYAANNATGSTIQNVSLKSMREMPIILPPLPLQTRFAAIVQKVEEQKALVQRSIDETQALFDSLMSTYFDD